MCGSMEVDFNQIFENEKNRLTVLLHRQLKRLKKRQEKAQIDLSACMQWKSVQKEGELLKAHFHLLKRGMDNVSVWDWEENHEVVIQLDPKKTPLEELSSRFRKSRKWEKGIPYRQEYLKEISDQLAQIQVQLDGVKTSLTVHEIEQLGIKDPQISLTQKKSKESSAKPLAYQEFESESGTKIWVGKNAKGNEILTFNLAKGLDWWLHTRGFSGSHVVIRTKKGEYPNPETVQDAVQLALHFSKAKKQGEGEVCITQKKFVSRFGRGSGKPGKVQISKHKYIFARLDLQRYQEIKTRLTRRDL